ncbi:MAG: NAD(P)-binding domain-containing protein [Pseudomonadota bacterium]
MSLKVGFVGTGHIAAPMARVVARAGHSVLVSERNEETAVALASAFENIAIAPNQAVLDGSDVVFLCVRPPLAEEVFSPLRFRPDHRVISVMAGVPMTTLRRLSAPATQIAVTIPLGFVEQGGCPLPVHPASKDLRVLFEPANPVLDVATEAALNSHFAICALVPGVLSLLETGADWLGAATGDRAVAELYTAQLMRGFLAASSPRSGGLAAERAALATEGTLSLQMVEALRERGVQEALRAALDAIGDRLDPAS